MRRRLFLTYFLLIIVSIAITGVLSLKFTEQNYLKMVEERLRDNGRIIKEYVVSNSEADGLDLLAKDFGEKLGIRMTIIDPEGRVVADSDADVSQMENHRSRPEIQGAYQGHITKRIRYSTTLQTKMMYVALPLNKNTGVLRVAMPLTQIYANLQAQWRNIFIALFITFLIASYLADRYSRNVAQPILEMAALSDKIASGDFDKRLRVKTRDEVEHLAEAFNSMASRLERSVGELRDKNLKLEAILSSMVNGIIAVDHDLHILLINPAAKEVFEIWGEVEGRYFLEVIRNSTLERLLVKALREGNTASMEVHLDGAAEEKILKLNAAPIKEDAATFGAVLLIQDITELRRLEQIRTDFVANVSHELKTPLTSVKGFVETLLEGALDSPETARKFLEIIDIETDRLARLINDILSLSEIESRRNNAVMEKLDLSQVVLETLQMMKAHAREKDISLGHLFAHENIFINTSRDRIKQMVINLVDNAIKYTPAGGSVTVLLEDFPDKVILRVRDTGIGIAKEHIPRLFERFYRVDKGRSRSMGGTGLGLAIVKHIVLSMKGEIQVQSEPGKGTEFIIIIPRG